jgi:hypothetical protein
MTALTRGKYRLAHAKLHPCPTGSLAHGKDNLSGNAREPRISEPSQFQLTKRFALQLHNYF